MNCTKWPGAALRQAILFVRKSRFISRLACAGESPAQAGVLLALALEEAHIQGLGAGAFRLHRR